MEWPNLVSLNIGFPVFWKIIIITLFETCLPCLHWDEDACQCSVCIVFILHHLVTNVSLNWYKHYICVIILLLCKHTRVFAPLCSPMNIFPWKRSFWKFMLVSIFLASFFSLNEYMLMEKSIFGS